MNQTNLISDNKAQDVTANDRSKDVHCKISNQGKQKAAPALQAGLLKCIFL